MDRIIINEYDYSASSTPTTSYSVGCTVINAPKGPKTPVYIQAGDLNALKDIFGSSKTATGLAKRDLYEVETYIKGNYGCYISAPYTHASSASSLKVKAVKVAADGTASVVDIDWDEAYETLEGITELESSEDYAFMIIPASPRAGGKMVVGITPNATDANVLDRFTVTCYEEGAYHDANKKYNIDIRLADGSKNASNSYIDTSLNNAPYASNNLFRIVKGAAALTARPTLAETNGALTFTGREFDSYDAGWTTIMSDPQIGKTVDVFFSVEDHTDVTSAFFSIAGSDIDFMQSCYIFNLTPTILTSAPPLSIAHGERYFNICGLGFTTTDGVLIKTNFIGARAVMQSRINESKLGGWAPMYLNAGGLGGQLGVAVSKMKQKYTKAEITALKEKCYNPIVKDPTYGVMMVAQGTCKGGESTDWSYIGHAAAFIIFEKSIRSIVMEPQIGKPNNPYYRELRATQVQRLLDARCSGDDRIWAAAIVDTSTADGVNDAANRSERKFVINVKVKVDVFSEFVELNFTNVGQDVEISE